MSENKKWSNKNSVRLSLALTWFCACVLLGCMVLAPVLLPKWFGANERLTLGVTVSFYVCCPMAITLIVCLLRLLGNIGRGNIFILPNVRLLRIISWCCFLVAAVTAVAMFVYPPFFFVVCSAGFLGLLLRVVKNVIAEACELKEENDLTI